MFVQYVRPTDEELFKVSWASASRGCLNCGPCDLYLIEGSNLEIQS